MSKSGGRTTPDELDYLFERDIIDEEDYVDFWSSYWRRGKHGRDELIDEYIGRSAEMFEAEGGHAEILSGIVTRNRSQAVRQAKVLSDSGVPSRIVRRNKRGQFSKRGRYYQAVRKTQPRKK